MLTTYNSGVITLNHFLKNTLNSQYVEEDYFMRAFCHVIS